MGIENHKSKWAKENDGYGYVVAAIEVFSRYALAVSTQTKTGKEVSEATESILEKFHNHFDRYPKFIVSDNGSEFVNEISC